FIFFRARKRSWRVVVPTLLPTLASFYYQCRAWREFSDAFKNGERRRCISEAKKEIERDWINFGFRIFRSKNGPNFRSERQLAVCDLVINQLNAHGIPGHDQPSLLRVPNGQTKHAIKAIKNFRAPFFVSVNNDFS